MSQCTAVVTMMFSKVKAPSWLPSLPGCERSANMEYAEWAPVGTLRWAEDGQLACPPLGWALLGGQQTDCNLQKALSGPAMKIASSYSSI